MHGVLGRIGQLSSVAYSDSSPHLGGKKKHYLEARPSSQSERETAVPSSAQITMTVSSPAMVPSTPSMG